MTPARLIISVYALWICYVCVMNLYRAKAAGTLRLPSKILGYPILFAGVVLDAFVNLTVCTVLLLELPRISKGSRWYLPDVEWLVTARLKRHKKAGGWRGRISAWVCTNLLDAFDPTGCHCD